MNFKVGQKVVCVYSGDWQPAKGAEAAPRPNKDEVVTVSGIASDGYLRLKEYPQHLTYYPKFFRPLDELSNVGINDLIEILPFQERKVKVNI